MKTVEELFAEKVEERSRIIDSKMTSFKQSVKSVQENLYLDLLIKRYEVKPPEKLKRPTKIDKMIARYCLETGHRRETGVKILLGRYVEAVEILAKALRISIDVSDLKDNELDRLRSLIKTGKTHVSTT
jgi:hypothetical protein